MGRRGDAIEILIAWENSSNVVLLPGLFRGLHDRPKDLAIGPE